MAGHTHNNQRPISTSNERVEEFLRNFGTRGVIIFAAFNAVNPLKRPCLDDEYLGNAEKFVEQAGWLDTIPDERSLTFLVEELVRRSFSASQTCYTPALKGAWVGGTDIFRISRGILEGFRKNGLKLENLRRF